MAKIADIATDGGDPRLSADLSVPASHAHLRPQARKIHDANVTFEEYHYYALQTRAEEETHSSEPSGRGILSVIFPSKSSKGAGMDGPTSDEKTAVPRVNTSSAADRAAVSDLEWTNASRAARTASIGAIFYLITTDILGPFNLPYAFALTGWGPGVALYTVFGFLAGVSGWLLWQCFMGLDSYQYPIRHYGDIAFRLYGTPVLYAFNTLQAIQLICSVGLIILSSGEALSEVSRFKLCYAVCCLIWALAGFGLGQIRTLQKLGWLANLSVWVHLLIVFITMGVAAHSPPLYSAYSSSAGGVYDAALVTPDAAGAFPPIVHTAGLPAPGQLSASLIGLADAIFAYGGAFIFTEFMAEMRRPRDFLKAMWAAQAFIYVVYMLYGMFVYAYQGQYVQTPAYLGIAGYAWQTVGNVLAIVGSLIAATLYGNIGLKVIYNSILVEFLHAPPLTHPRGKLLWAALIPLYWSAAYVLAAAIPAFGGFQAVVSAACILPFTYVFPPLLNVGFHVQKNAARGDNSGTAGTDARGFDPADGRVARRDAGLRRAWRGFAAGGAVQVALNVWNVVYFAGAVATMALGLYAGITGLVKAFETPEVNAFKCRSPLDSGS